MAKIKNPVTPIVSVASQTHPEGTGIATGKSSNPMYDALYKANPYTNLTYNKSVWQNLLSSFGFRTDYDRWKEQAQVNAAEYDAQVASIEQQNAYNSPANQALLMKQAGQNPDLLGTQGVSDSASPVQDVNGMEPNVDEAGQFGEITQKLWNFGVGVMNCYTMAVGFAKDMLSMKQMKNAVESQDVSLLQDFMKFQNDLIVNEAPFVPFDNDADYSSHRNYITHKLMDMPKNLHMSRRQRRIWNQVYGSMMSAPNFERLTAHWKQSASNLNDLSHTPRHFYRYDERDQWKAFDVVSHNLSSLADEVWKFQQQNLKDVADAGSATAKFEKKVAVAKDSFRDDATRFSGAQAVAHGELSQSLLSYQTAGIDKAINSTMSRIVTELERQANEGDLLSAGLLLAFNIFRMSNFKFK